MNTPIWGAATSGQAANAGAINQFLGTHAVVYVYAGALAASNTAAGASNTASHGLYIAQSFATATGQTQVGRVMANILQVGAATTPWSFSIQASVSGAPSGTPLVTCNVPQEFCIALNGAGTFGWVSIPLPCTVTPSTTYWIVAAPEGVSSNDFAWRQSTATGGASTSTNGTTWTPQTYGLMYQVCDQTPTAPLTHTYEDAGARWTSYVSSGTTGQLTGEMSFTVGQTSTGYAVSTRTLSYSGSTLTGVT